MTVTFQDVVTPREKMQQLRGVTAAQIPSSWGSPSLAARLPSDNGLGRRDAKHFPLRLGAKLSHYSRDKATPLSYSQPAPPGRHGRTPVPGGGRADGVEALAALGLLTLLSKKSRVF